VSTVPFKQNLRGPGPTERRDVHQPLLRRLEIEPVWGRRDTPLESGEEPRGWAADTVGVEFIAETAHRLRETGYQCPVASAILAKSR
jgi:hypothetical protein